MLNLKKHLQDLKKCITFAHVNINNIKKELNYDKFLVNKENGFRGS